MDPLFFIKINKKTREYIFIKRVLVCYIIIFQYLL